MSRDRQWVRHGVAVPLLLSSSLLECFVWATDPEGEAGGLPLPSYVSSEPPHPEEQMLWVSPVARHPPTERKHEGVRSYCITRYKKIEYARGKRHVKETTVPGSGWVTARQQHLFPWMTDSIAVCVKTQDPSFLASHTPQRCELLKPGSDLSP